MTPEQEHFTDMTDAQWHQKELEEQEQEGFAKRNKRIYEEQLKSCRRFQKALSRYLQEFL